LSNPHPYSNHSGEQICSTKGRHFIISAGEITTWGSVTILD
jgi:hypothetical protein